MISPVLDKLLDVLDGSGPASAKDYGDLVDDQLVALASTIAHMPQQLREEQLMLLEHGMLRADVEKIVHRMHKSYPRVVSSKGELQ
jgi:hypothetical protein